MKKKTPSKKTVKKPKPLSRIIAATEAKAFRVENPKGLGAGVIICDHASHRVPRALKDLGLPKTDLKKHIGWDIGAEDVSRSLGKALDMPVILASYSRLVTDLNRAPHYHECMAAESDHIKVPGNTGISKKEKDLRLKEIYWPYQNQIGKLVDRAVKKGQVPVLFAIHSFTPAMDNVKRPWHIAILWNREEKIAKQLVKNIRKNHPDVLVGENEPYTLFDERFTGSTICRRAEERGLPYVFVEFRQDLISTKETAAFWADVLFRAVAPILANPEISMNRKIKPLKK